MARILIVDDEENIRKTLQEILEDAGHEVLCAVDGEQGVKLFAEEYPDVVLADIKMPRKDGLTVLNEIKAYNVDCEVIMISGHGTIELAVQAIKQGAFHFLQKPPALIEVRQIVSHAVTAKQQRDELKSFKNRDAEKYTIVGASREIQYLKTQIAKIAPTAGRVLIQGESGSGKELVAYAIHKQSDRVSGPFVKVNCAAIPENLIESELFGHEKGAFTGAVAQKKGKFELADKGTLLLDEIGDMDLNTQTKVLRAIQEGEFERVGGTKIIKIDVRIIAATHRNLEQMIADGSFREDLYYRLCVLPIKAPSLAARTEDIPVLAAHFLDYYCKENGQPPKTFTQDALTFLMHQNYPGNIRQLKNIVERTAILAPGDEIRGDFVRSILDPTNSASDNDIFVKARPLQVAKDELEKLFIQTQLKLHDWNIPATAEILGLQRTNLHRKIRQLGIEKTG
ncbi:MAG: response regulator [Chitinivibrionales bacterium]|nr:response regulator [Chitinivibrionales bacterium]